MTDKNLYSRKYWEGGQPDGSGYKGVGYQNFPAQMVVLDKILERKPESLLDIGGSRGYIAKMFEQATGKPGWCLDISEYCHATRVTDKFILGDITNPEWFGFPYQLFVKDNQKQIDLVFSIAVFEHIKEEDLPLVISRISNIAKRGLICPSFYDVGEPDHTHETLKPKEWWEATFAKYAPGWPVEIVDKEEMEKGDFKFQMPKQVNANGQVWTLAGRYVDQDIETLSGKNDRAIVLNVSSYIVMWRSNPDICVINTDMFDDLHGFAGGWGYNYTQYTAPGKLPFKDGSVDAINCSHMLEHLDRTQGLEFLKECLRVLKPNGRLRITVPDAEKVCYEYIASRRDYPAVKKLNSYSIYNEGVEKAEDDAERLYHMLLGGGHKTVYDSESLRGQIKRAGFYGVSQDNFNEFHHCHLIGQVGWDMYPENSLYVSAWKEGDDSSGDILVLSRHYVSGFAPTAESGSLMVSSNNSKIIEELSKKASGESIQSGAQKKDLNKICLISTPYIPVNPSGYGGLETVVGNLGKGLAKAGYDVTIIAPEGSTVEGCNIFTIGKPTGMQVNWLQAESNASKLYKDLIENYKFDIIHDHTWFSRIYGLKAINPSQKICHTHHGHLNPDWIQYVKGFTPTPNLIAISNWMRKLWLAQFKIFSKVAHNGIDTDIYKYDPNVIPGDRLLFVGRLDTLKNPMYAIEVAEKVGMPLDIVGSVNWSANKEYANQVIERAKKNGYNVYLEATTEQKVALYQRAKALLVTSTFGEPFGLIMPEALSCGAPVVYLSDGGLDEIGKNQSFMTMGADDLNWMVKMVQCIGDIDHESRIRKARHVYIKNNFSIDTLAKRSTYLYKQIINGEEW